MAGQMVDSYGRKVTGIRIALTPRCNLRCIYCHHEGELLPGGEIPGEMVVSIAKAAAELGMRSVKFTGGEPLLRKDLDLIVARIPQSLDISITTNGILLAERAEALARAGLDRVNVSLDSLQPNRYCQITGGRPGDLERVLAGIDASREADLLPLKLNFVVLKRNESEVPEMIDFCRGRGLILQLIELLDIQGQGISGDIEGIERSLAARADSILTREMHRRKKYFLDGAEVEVVRPMDNTEFCAHCTRLRVTSEGKIKPCLLRSDNLVKIDSCDPARIKELLRMANARREPYFGNVCRPVADAPFIESKII
ncbi:MAG: GTP 3',8-cyclase MoaA [Methanothrix soehngenii]|uniref:GTP 3',8-cyclase MoaA n=1 Tax=Methanothrix soehngenii TaxID=2223 RepID=UPI0023F2D0CB|nr:GTP 3',8-cyclase MoaA [Methanothrix soehngenii]MDD5256875.1 GTP 3',8-cyclase MoaA [Methanothrix soehngenii]